MRSESDKGMKASTFSTFNRTKIFKAFTQSKKLITISRKASVHYRTSFLGALKRCIALRLKRGYKPEEAFQRGVLDPKLTERDHAKFCSKKSMVTIQKSVNPLGHVGCR